MSKIAVNVLAKNNINDKKLVEPALKEHWKEINNLHDQFALEKGDQFLVKKYGRLIGFKCNGFAYGNAVTKERTKLAEDGLISDFEIQIPLPNRVAVIEEVNVCLQKKIGNFSLHKSYKNDKAAFKTYFEQTIVNEIHNYIKWYCRRIQPSYLDDFVLLNNKSASSDVINKMEDLPDFMRDVKRLAISLLTKTNSDRAFFLFCWFLIEIEHPFDVAILGKIFPDFSRERMNSILAKLDLNLCRDKKENRYEVLGQHMKELFGKKNKNGKAVSKDYRRMRKVQILALIESSELIKNKLQSEHYKEYYKQLVKTYLNHYL